MPFCPRCRQEFQDWVEACPDCHVALAAEPPTAPGPTSRRKRTGRSARANDPLVLVATASNEPEARMWAKVLENNGIHCLRKGWSHLELMTPYSPPLPGEVYVPESCAQTARELLDNVSGSTGAPLGQAEVESDSDAELEEETRCPECGLQVPETSVYCQECGAKLHEDVEPGTGESPETARSWFEEWVNAWGQILGVIAASLLALLLLFIIIAVIVGKLL